MSDTPSWVTPTGTGRRPRPAADQPGSAPTLVAVVVLTTALPAAEVVHVVGRDELVAGLRGFLVLVIALQVPLAVATMRRSAGGALTLLACQVTTIVASLTGGFGDLRLALAAGAALVIGLVAASLKGFPSVTLPDLPRHG